MPPFAALRAYFRAAKQSPPNREIASSDWRHPRNDNIQTHQGAVKSPMEGSHNGSLAKAQPYYFPASPTKAGKNRIALHQRIRERWAGLSGGKKGLVILILALLPVACALPAVVNSPAAYIPSHSILVIADANATPTPTPFQPLPATPYILPTEYPTPTTAPTSEPAPTEAAIYKSWGDYPGPTIWPDLCPGYAELPPPTGLLAQPSDQVNILLLGSDQRPNDYGFRTDTILLVTLSPSLGTVSITTFPRDLYIYIPGYTVQRINTAFAVGDFATLALTFEYNLGVRPDHYVIINFWSFKEVVDSLGGIDVNVAVDFSDQRDGYGDEPYFVPAGVVHMDGDTALWYVRSRKTTSDFDRGRRQKEVIQAAYSKLMSLNAIARAPELYEIYRQNVVTDLTLEDITPLLPLAMQLTDMSRIHGYAIGPNEVYDYMNLSSSAVLCPRSSEALLGVMRQALNSP